MTFLSSSPTTPATQSGLPQLTCERSRAGSHLGRGRELQPNYGVVSSRSSVPNICTRQTNSLASVSKASPERDTLPICSVTEILHWTTFQEFASCCSTIVQISLHKNGMDTGRCQMRESLESQIPDTAAYTEWLAIVCSIVVAALFCAVLFSNGLT